MCSASSPGARPRTGGAVLGALERYRTRRRRRTRRPGARQAAGERQQSALRKLGATLTPLQAGELGLSFQLRRRKLVPGLGAAVSALSPALHPVAVSRWFTTQNPDLVVDDSFVSPIDWLAAGGAPEAVATLAGRSTSCSAEVPVAAAGRRPAEDPTRASHAALRVGAGARLRMGRSASKPVIRLPLRRADRRRALRSPRPGRAARRPVRSYVDGDMCRRGLTRRPTVGSATPRSESVIGRIRSRTIRPAPECVPPAAAAAEPVRMKRPGGFGDDGCHRRPRPADGRPALFLDPGAMSDSRGGRCRSPAASAVRRPRSSCHRYG